MNRPCHTCKKNTHHEIVYERKVGGKLVTREVKCEECGQKTTEDYTKVNK